jgi:ABC-type transporter Mla subunit MlaD
MTATTTLYDPTAPRQAGAAQAPQALARLAGRTVGFIDNAKPNFNHLVDDLAELLVARHGVARVIKRRKHSASVPAPDDMVEELAACCDLVIAGSGD